MSNLYIEKLILIRNNGDEFEYKFTRGINYFVGENGCGKTEFLLFIDFMLGSSSTLDKKEWYYEFEKGILVLRNNDTQYYFTRFKDIKKLSFRINDEEDIQCNIDEYKLYLSEIIIKENKKPISHLNEYVDFKATIRSLTAFNFFESDGVGLGYKSNILTKCREYKYQKWILLILDYLFNPNSEEIINIKKQLDNLKKTLKEQQNLIDKLAMYRKTINDSLMVFGSNCELKNSKESITKVKSEIERIKTFHNESKIPHYEDLYYFNDLSERIEIIKNEVQDITDFQKAAENRIGLLNRLKELANKSNSYKSLIEPIVELITELNTTVNFSKVIVEDKPLKSLENLKNKIQRETEIKYNKSISVELDEKIQNISIAEKFVNNFEKEYKDINIEDTQRQIAELEDELNKLTINVDNKKIDNFCKLLYKLYFSATEESALIKADSSVEGFILDYIPKTNSIIPSTVVINDDDTDAHVEKYRGSQARSAIIQLCGYCALNIIIQQNNNIPCMPLLVIDYISQPITDNNIRSIGTILKSFIKEIHEDNFQVILIDVEDAAKMNLSDCNVVKLVNDIKSGFIPWYTENKS